MKWYTYKEYEIPDEETGEIIRKGTMPKGYEIINKNTKTIIHENTGIRTITYYCERKRQLELF